MPTGRIAASVQRSTCAQTQGIPQLTVHFHTDERPADHYACLHVCVGGCTVGGIRGRVHCRFGRTEENFGEDPALVAAMGAAAVLGLHGGNSEGPSSYLPKGAIVSEAKHAAAYGFGGKDGAAADLSERTLHDIYLR